jgi:Mg2+/citrate symporter
MVVGMKRLIISNDCLRYSLIPPEMVSMFGVNNITTSYEVLLQQSIEIKHSVLLVPIYLSMMDSNVNHIKIKIYLKCLMETR